jgi:hypothetical protein
MQGCAVQKYLCDVVWKVIISLSAMQGCAVHRYLCDVVWRVTYYLSLSAMQGCAVHRYLCDVVWRVIISLSLLCKGVLRCVMWCGEFLSLYLL